MSPGDVVIVPDVNICPATPEGAFSLDTQQFMRFKRGPALVLSIVSVDTSCGDVAGNGIAVELMDSAGRTGWTDIRIISADFMQVNVGRM